MATKAVLRQSTNTIAAGPADATASVQEAERLEEVENVLVESGSAVFETDLLAAAAADMKRAAAEPLRVQLREKTPFMYKALLGDDLSGRSDDAHIVFAWYPRDDMWSTDQMLWRSLRALSACRPEIDIIALPDLPDGHSSFETWCEVYGLQEWQAVWYDPMLSATNSSTDGSDQPAADRSNLVLQDLLNKLLLTAQKLDVDPAQFHVYHSHATADVRDDIRACGLTFLGDVDEHHVIKTLQEAKGWLHADYDTNSSRPSLATELRNGTISCDTVHIPRGFVCHTVEEQFEAFRKLKASKPPPRLVLKPSDGFFSAGVVLDATEDDLAPLTAPNAWVKGESYIIEEMVGAPGGPSPTVYMCGKTAVVVGDQIISKTALQGNIVPSSMPEAMQQAMADTGAAIAEFLGLKGHWGMDFAIDEAQRPVVVDLNMGRPNGSLAFFLWRAQQTPPPTLASSCADQLYQCVIERFGPAGETLDDIIRILRDHDLLWLPGDCTMEGVVPVYCLSKMSHERRPEAHSDTKLIIASWKGRDALSALISRLRLVDKIGTYKAFDD